MDAREGVEAHLRDDDLVGACTSELDVPKTTTTKKGGWRDGDARTVASYALVFKAARLLFFEV